MKKTTIIALVAAILGVTPVYATEKPSEAPACAVAPASKSTVKKLNDDTAIRPGFKKKHLVVIDFNATWCGPCKQFAPVFDAVAAKYAKKAEFISVDIDKCPETANAFGIRAIPTVLFIYPDGTTKTFVGTEDILPSDKFEKLIKESITVGAIKKRLKK